MRPTNRTARSIGWLYVVTMTPAPLNLVYLSSRFMVPGNPAATAERISSGELVYRLCTLAGFFNAIMFIVLGLSLYNLFKDVDRKQARLLVAFVLVTAAIGLVNLISELAPLLLLREGQALSAFSKSQLDALAYGFLRLRGTGLGIEAAFWGLWLLPFGILVIKSGFIPKLIGVLLIAGCAGYLLQSLTAILWPAQANLVFNATIPLVGPGEIAIIIWFFARGNRVMLPSARLSFAG